MADIKKLQMNGQEILPVTHESAVYDSDGKSIASKYITSENVDDSTDIQIDNSLAIGDINQLKTTNKSTLVDALNEVFQSGNDVKSKLVGALIAQGVLSSTSETFDELISKVKNMEGSGGGSSLQYATGRITWDYENRITTDKVFTVDDMGFTPTSVFVVLDSVYCTRTVAAKVLISNYESTTINEDTEYYVTLKVTNITSTSFTIDFIANYANGHNLRDGLTWYAFGESSSNSGGLDIITASSLPATGKENQICIISSDPDYDVLVTTNAKEALVDPTIVMYLGNSASSDLTLGTQAQIGNMMYYFNRVMFGTERLPSYMWCNNQWNELTKAYIPIMERGICVNTTFFTGTYVEYIEGTGLQLASYSSSSGIRTTSLALYNFSNYTRVEFEAYMSSYSRPVSIYAQSYTETGIGNLAESLYKCGAKTVNTTRKTFTFDISSWKGEGYLGFYAEAASYTDYFVYITDIRLY